MDLPPPSGGAWCAPGTGSTRGRTCATGLDALRREHVTATLSNGHLALLVDLARHGDLRFDCLLSAELARAYKPAPEVYRTAARLLGVEPGELMLVAAHPWDLQGARAAGLRTAFVDRPLEYGPGSPAREYPTPTSRPATCTSWHSGCVRDSPDVRRRPGHDHGCHESHRTRPDALGPRHERPKDPMKAAFLAVAFLLLLPAAAPARTLDLPTLFEDVLPQVKEQTEVPVLLPQRYRCDSARNVPERRGPQAAATRSASPPRGTAAAPPPASSPTSAPSAARIRTTRARSGSPAGAPAISSR